MAKLTQTQAREKVDEWAKLAKTIEKAEAAKRADTEVLEKKHQAAIQPILDHHDPKIQTLREKQAAIEAEVLGWLNGVGKPIVLDGVSAVAINEFVVGKRVISVEQFFDRVKERSVAFWDCLAVRVSKAETLIGKKAVDEISTKERKLVPTLKLK